MSEWKKASSICFTVLSWCAFLFVFNVFTYPLCFVLSRWVSENSKYEWVGLVCYFYVPVEVVMVLAPKTALIMKWYIENIWGINNFTFISLEM